MTFEVDDYLSSLPAQALAFIMTYHDFKNADLSSQFSPEELHVACQGSRLLSAIHDFTAADLKLAFASTVLRKTAKRFGISFPDDQKGIDKFDDSSARSRLSEIAYSILPYDNFLASLKDLLHLSPETDRLEVWKELSLEFSTAQLRADDVEKSKELNRQTMENQSRRMKTRESSLQLAAAATTAAREAQFQSPSAGVAGRFGAGRIRNNKSPALPLINSNSEYFNDIDRIDEAIQILAKRRDALDAGAIEEDEDEEFITPSRRGPKPRSNTEIYSDFRAVQKRVLYLDTKVNALQKHIESCTNPVLTTADSNIGEAVLKAYKDAGVMRGVIHGQKNSLTNVSGFIANLLNTVGLVSFNQMPLVILLVITLVFGLLPNDVLLTLSSCTQAYSNAAKRVGVIMNRELQTLFTHSDRDCSILCATLMLDASEKANRSWNIKMVAGLCKDDTLKLWCWTLI